MCVCVRVRVGRVNPYPQVNLTTSSCSSSRDGDVVEVVVVVVVVVVVGVVVGVVVVVVVVVDVVVRVRG